MVIEIKERNLNKNNRTPLQLASKGSKMEELLISKGAKKWRTWK